MYISKNKDTSKTQCLKCVVRLKDSLVWNLQAIVPNGYGAVRSIARFLARCDGTLVVAAEPGPARRQADAAVPVADPRAIGIQSESSVAVPRSAVSLATSGQSSAVFPLLEVMADRLANLVKEFTILVVVNALIEV